MCENYVASYIVNHTLYFGSRLLKYKKYSKPVLNVVEGQVLSKDIVKQSTRVVWFGIRSARLLQNFS